MPSYKNKNYIRSVDEMFGKSTIRMKAKEHCKAYWDWFINQKYLDLKNASNDAMLIFKKFGITYNVNTDSDEHHKEASKYDRVIPFDLIPRIISNTEWSIIEKGLIQRVNALNSFLHDVYHEAKIFSANLIPADLIYKNSQFRYQMRNVEVANKIYAHISGVDLIRTNNDFLVLEDNVRVPSGVSYMIENRKIMMRLFPEVFEMVNVSPIEHYPDLLLRHLKSITKNFYDDPCVVLLTPGTYNSAYFEHAYLAQKMGVELVEGRDLFVSGDKVYMKTTGGSIRVDVIYRRIDDNFMDPLFFNPDSVLGVPGLLSVIRSGGVTVCNALGTGIADDKSVYPFVPQMIKFYLGEEPILKNIKTFLCRNKRHKGYVLANLENLVVKEVHGAGGVGMLVGPLSTKREISMFKTKINSNPENFIAQPMLALSTSPIFVEKGVSPRHVDLRPFILHGKNTSVIPGGLTRVALKEGSVVVNSSQGGGTKDTWVVWNHNAK